MNFREDPSDEMTFLRMRDTLKAHESMIFSLQTIVEKQQEMLEKMAGRELKVQKPSFLETIDLEKMMKIALFAAALYNEDGTESHSI
ncbi:hypothetical protein ACQCVP_05235 [Rossellomorea vietnamensis]|uniref:hypothetical protein n=1 Tax=Rossellomorea vietnamensis TaxID=218284 RepID=UPI003CE848DA